MLFRSELLGIDLRKSLRIQALPTEGVGAHSLEIVLSLPAEHLLCLRGIRIADGDIAGASGVDLIRDLDPCRLLVSRDDLQHRISVPGTDVEALRARYLLGTAKSRDVRTQAVFSLRGKPLNSFGLSKSVVYENEEFNCLQSALNIEDGLDELRYNKVIIATDADVDGMHIRLLMLTFFLQFFPDLVKKGHVYILQTPLFRVKNKKETRYCYSEEERVKAIEDLKPNPEITRFKGLGEISPDEFKGFIGKEIRLDQVTLRKEDAVKDLLNFYMGKNTTERQNFIINNLVVEEDVE